MTEPTDNEIMLEASKVGGLFDDLAIGYQADDILKLARAVLAKWGTPPAVAGEPAAPDFYTACALYEEGGEACWIPLPGYSNETEHGVKHLVLEAARKEGYKGTAAGRLLELGWEIRPVYLTPQPTQAQAWPPKSWIDEVRGYLTAAADSSMSRNNSEQLASELLEQMPTQAQAGAVPLPKFLALKFHARRDKKATVTLLFPGHEAADAWVRGIKGGQHGPS